MSDEQSMSKRERQKARRAQKREQQQAEAARAQRKRLGATVALVALVLAGIGALGFGWWSDRQERARLIADAQERLGELGCTEVQEPANMGASHFTAEQLAQSPPELVYPDRPATSGTHYQSWAITGVYEKVIDERILVHNLEHGYVNVFYTDDAPDDQVAELTAAAERWIDGRYQKVIVSRWKADLPGDARFALTAWDARQLCEEFDEGVALAFLEDWHHLSGHAPERTAPAHVGAETGMDPGAVDGDFLLPPLSDDAPDAPVMEDIDEDVDEDDSEAPADGEPEPDS